MAGTDPLEARFPTVPPKAGHYESFYLKACHPTEPLGVWIRHTVHKRPGAEPNGSVWFALFDGSAEGPRASKVTLPAPETGGGELIRVGESRLRDGEAAGEARSERCDASWELRFAGEEPMFHLPRDWMYRARVPRTKSLSPHPAARFSGRVSVDGVEIEVGDWPGMLGHNWGAEHAERWIWLHGLGFQGAGQATWLDATIGRVKLGPLTTPWIANGVLSLDGERDRLGGPEKIRSTEVREAPERCEFTLPGRGVSVQGIVQANRKDFVGWIYADPEGGEHNTVNCSIADMTLSVRRDGAAPLDLELLGGAAYELGMRERDHGVEMQPFPDG
jgi:hypothetical protein